MVTAAAASGELSEAAKRVPAHLLDRSRLGARALEREAGLTTGQLTGTRRHAVGAGFGATRVVPLASGRQRWLGTQMTDAVLTLQEAADELGVHYMTAYRYVRLGVMEASKSGGVWQVQRSAVDRFREDAKLAAATVGPSGKGGAAQPSRHRGRVGSNRAWSPVMRRARGA